jgi:CheY-like chemotaxis protein
MNKGKYHFIVIDDSRLDCFIAEKVIKNTNRYLSVSSYADAREALEFIQSSNPASAQKSILIVDVQMPLMNGFEFIEAFEKLAPQIQDNFLVNVLTSSTNRSDITRIQSYASVKNLLNKPLTPLAFSAVLEGLEDENDKCLNSES